MPRDDDLLFFHRWIFQNGWARSPTIRFAIGLDWMGKVNGWTIGTDCEKLAKGVWRLIVIVTSSGTL